MIDADLFDKLEQIARQVRRNTKPFGGIQVGLHPNTLSSYCQRPYLKHSIFIAHPYW
jgi:hypothetical protein